MSEKISFVIPYPRAREQRERKVHVAGKGTFIQNKSFRARLHGERKRTLLHKPISSTTKIFFDELFN
jgi:hypothetical protein